MTETIVCVIIVVAITLVGRLVYLLYRYMNDDR